MKPKNDFDNVATIYDTLAYLVFGKSIRNAQRAFLGVVPIKAKVLILGGGTGWIVSEVFSLNATCHVTYVEASSKMIELARRKIKPHDLHRILFVHSQDVATDIIYDVVITNFFLDLFPSDKVAQLIVSIKSIIHKNGYWILSDFINDGSGWKKFLLKVMYYFFHKTCNIEASSLPPWEKLLHDSEVLIVGSKMFYGRFIKSLLIGSD